jgi:hypothetical protein
MNPVSNLSNTYLQSYLGNIQASGSKGSSLDPSSLMSPQNGNAQDSTFAQLMSTIQQTQQSDLTGC